MQISSIESSIFGKYSLLQPECPVVVITGPNEAGKTTLLKGPALAIDDGRKGFPLIGKTGARFWVKAMFQGDNGDAPLALTREVNRRGKHTLEIDDEPGKLADGQAVISERLGEAPTFSLSDMLGMTPQKRLRWMEDKILQSVDRDLSQDVARFAGKLVTLCGYDEMPKSITQEDLVKILDDLRGIEKASHSEALRIGRAVKQDEKEAKSDELPDGTVDSWRKRIADLGTEAGTVAQELGKIDGAQQARANLETQIAGTEAVVTAAQSIDLAALRQEWEARIKGHEDGQKAERALLGEKVKASEESQEAEAAAKDKYTEAHKKLAAVTGTVEALTSIPEFLCTDCQERMKTEHAAAQSRLEAAKKAAAGANAQLGAAERQHTAATKAVTSQKRTFKAAERTTDAARKKMDEALQAAEATIERAQGASEKLEQLRQELMDIPDDLSASSLREQLAGIKAEQAECQKKADALTDNAAILATREQRRIDLSKAKRRRDDARDLLAELGPEGLLGRLLSQASAPFLERVNSILEPVTGSRVWVDTRGGFTWGYERATDLERHVPIETASESHQLAAMTAFEITAKTYLTGWRAVFIDGLEVMGHDRRTAFVKQLIKCCDVDLLDNAWVASVADGWTPPVGCHVQELAA